MAQSQTGELTSYNTRYKYGAAGDDVATSDALRDRAARPHRMYYAATRDNRERLCLKSLCDMLCNCVDTVYVSK